MNNLSSHTERYRYCKSCADDLYSVGTVAKVKELIKLPKGIVRVLVAGKYKGMVNTVSESDGMLISDIVTDRDWF